MNQGIPDSAIEIENRSKNTFENGLYTKHLLDSLNIHEPVVLVTSAVHIERAEQVFKKCGIEVVPFPCDYDIVNVKQYITDYFWPNIEIISKWKLLLKEWVGIAEYKFRGKISLLNYRKTGLRN